ncbi:MAG: hypothetical protein M3Q46_13330 [Verrucomicrobiota bacterium]|nr:hypothetical protein [Verrucomicrobiota bacterium]
MKTPRFLRRTLALGSFGLLLLATSPATKAGSATWNQNPTSGDWNTAANWMPNTVPNSEADVATFGQSNVTDVTIPQVYVSIVFLITEASP